MTSNFRTDPTVPPTNLSAPGIASLVILALLTGCFGGPPGEEQAKSDLQELIRSRSDDAIQLTGFRKVDGQSRELMGVTVYEMDVEGRIEIMKECYWTPLSRVGEVFSAKVASEDDGYWDSFRKNSMSRKHSSKGEQHSFNGSLLFEKKESGWHLGKLKIDALDE